MFITNPFAQLAVSIPPEIMESYVAAMIVLVVAGTIYDMNHKKSATYFFGYWRKARKSGNRQGGLATLLLLGLQTAFEALLSGEFCNLRRRLAHLLTMYGFLAYAAGTVAMVFFYSSPGAQTPAIWPAFWHAGALMICLGGYWFWFFIRADVAAEGQSPYRIVRADLFVLSLLASATAALFWSWFVYAGNPWSSVLLAVYLIATTLLFASVPWSKFSHMFYKPAAAFQKRVEDADGWRGGLPSPVNKPEMFGSARRQPNHY